MYFDNQYRPVYCRDNLDVFAEMTKKFVSYFDIFWLTKRSCSDQGEAGRVEVDPPALLDLLTLPLNDRIDCYPSWIFDFDLIRVGQLQMSK